MDSSSDRRAPARPSAGAAGHPPRLATPLLHAAALIALLALAAPARASIRPADPARIAGPTLVAPAEGARLVESAAHFAFELPRGAWHPTLVISRREFDPSSWSAIPNDPDLTQAEREGRSPFEACPDSPAVEAIGRLADLLLEQSAAG